MCGVKFDSGSVVYQDSGSVGPNEMGGYITHPLGLEYVSI